MRSSEYSLTPSNTNVLRAGRTARVSGGGSRLFRLGKDLTDSKLTPMYSSPFNMDKHVANASGEMYPALVILARLSTTRSLVDKRSFGSVGNGTRQSVIAWRRGADPPKNASITTGASRAFSSQ